MLKQDREYTVYKHTSPSGKVYVGITCQDVKRRWQNGFGYFNNEYFTRAIVKYGWDNFVHEILYTGLCLEEAKTKEKECIKLWRSNEEEFGYNLSDGGEAHSGCKFSEETRKKMSESHIGKTYTMSEETKQKISAALKGKKKSEEHIRKLKEHRIPPEQRKKISQTLDYIKRSVQCIETGEVFESAYDAKRKYGMHPASINRACKTGGRAHGYHWIFTSDNLQANTEITIETKESIAS